jgi:hypothetical protein
MDPLLLGENVNITCNDLKKLTFRFICFGPEESMVRYGKFTSVWREDESSIFAFSAASFKRCIAIGSFVTSIPCCNVEIQGYKNHNTYIHRINT